MAGGIVGGVVARQKWHRAGRGRGHPALIANEGRPQANAWPDADVRPIASSWMRSCRHTATPVHCSLTAARRPGPLPSEAPPPRLTQIARRGFAPSGDQRDAGQAPGHGGDHLPGRDYAATEVRHRIADVR
jgi:hypothetical protein